MIEISTTKLDWEIVVEELAQKGVPFVVANFTYAHHFAIYEILRDIYRLKVYVDWRERKALFEPTLE